MNNKKLFSTLALGSILISSALAANVEFQNISVGGLGCPSDITQIVTAPDLSSASLIFQSFESHVPTVASAKGGGTTVSNLNCNVFLDIKLPQGLKLDSIEISYDMRGNAFLDREVSGSFKSYLISANGLGSERTQGPQLIVEKDWFNTIADQEEDFTVQAKKVLPLSSQCGSGSNSDRVSLHLQHQLGSQILRGALGSAQGTITMDSSDITGGIKIKANTSICRIGPNDNGNGNGGGRGNGRNCRVIRIGNRAQMVCQ